MYGNKRNGDNTFTFVAIDFWPFGRFFSSSSFSVWFHNFGRGMMMMMRSIWKLKMWRIFFFSEWTFWINETVIIMMCDGLLSVIMQLRFFCVIIIPKNRWWKLSKPKYSLVERKFASSDLIADFRCRKILALYVGIEITIKIQLGQNGNVFGFSSNFKYLRTLVPFP